MNNYVFSKTTQNVFDMYDWDENKLNFQNLANIIETLNNHQCPYLDIKMLVIRMITIRYALKIYRNIVE